METVNGGVNQLYLSKNFAGIFPIENTSTTCHDLVMLIFHASHRKVAQGPPFSGRINSGRWFVPYCEEGKGRCLTSR